MKLNDLLPMIILLVMTGVIIGAGILVVDSFGSAVRDPTAVSENVNSSAGTFTVTNIPLKEVARFGNATKYNTTFNCAGCEVNYTAATGVFVVNNVTFDPSWDWYVNYTYYKNSTATDTMTDTTAAITPITSTWMTLLVTIIVLALIFGVVINSFGRRN